MAQVTTRQNKLPSVKDFFEKPAVKQKIQELLNKNAATFSTSVLQIVNSDALLKDAEPMTILNAACMAATLNLPLQNGLGFAYIVPYKNNKTKKYEAQAEPFETWVFEEVLPQIRKTGKYEVQPQQLALPEPKPRGILLDEEAFYVVAKAIAKLNESTFEWEKMMDLFSELESHRNYKTAFNLGVASYNLAQSSEKIIMKNLVQMKNKAWKKEIEDFIFSNPHLQNHTENKLVHYLR
ncbi:prophage antirepressor [Pasteurella multocida subsp. multocida OH4807]|nr:prophage antirepressor [Pasteurella multocida subsp. multocida OH4807]